MPLEVATYISGLDSASPTATDPKSQGDDHIRLLKSTLRATFPNINAPVQASASQIDDVAMNSRVRQGGGAGQGNNTVYIGWAGTALNLQIDAVSYGKTWPIDINGQAGSTRNATGGYMTAVSPVGPVYELHKPGVAAAAFYLNAINQVGFGPTVGDGIPTFERMRFDQSTGDQWIQGALTQASDERLKANWRPLCSDFVAQLAGVKAGIYDRTDIDLTQVGVSAQSLREVLPEAVHESECGELSVAYANAALAACVEFAKELVALREKVAALEAVQ